MLREKLTSTLLRIKALWHRRQLEQDLEDEMAFHLAARRDAAPQEGRGVQPRFGNATRIKEETRDLWLFAAWENFWRDVRYGLRSLRKSPAFAITATLTLALGIGVNAGVFAIFDGAVFRPLPVNAPGEVYQISQTFTGKFARNVSGEGSLISAPEFAEYVHENEVFSGATAFAPFVSATLGGDAKRDISGTLASCEYFDVLRIKPELGRTFTASDCAAAGSGTVVILNDSTWRSSFGSDPGIIGRPIVLNRVPSTVIGVAPPGFDGTEFAASEFWAPFTMHDTLFPETAFFNDANMSWLVFLGRAKPGVSSEAIHSNLNVIAAHLGARYPQRVTHISVRAATLFASPEERPVALGAGAVMMIAVALVLAIVCANLANLLQARGTARSREIAVRQALGASRGQLVRQLLTENLIVALAGGAIGTLFAVWTSGLVVRILLGLFQSTEIGSLRLHVGPDWRVFTYCLCVSLATGLTFGLLPALRASRADLDTVIKTGASTTRKHNFTGRALVAVQVAFCMVLLLVTGLALRGLYRAQTFEPGFDIHGVTAVAVNLQRQGYTPQRATQFQRDLRDRLAAMPGVTAVAQATVAPLSGDHWITGMKLASGTELGRVENDSVTSDFLPLMGIPIVRGRNFTARETETGAPLAIVSEALARAAWPGKDALGETFRADDDDSVALVIGIAANTNISNPANMEQIYLYRPAGPANQLELHTFVRMANSVSADAAVRQAILASDRDLWFEAKPLEANLEVWRMPARIVAMIGAVVAALALSIASLGVFGMVAHGVSRRMREISIRMAIGAEGRDVRNMIVRQALRPVVLGAAIGLAVCGAISGTLSLSLFGVTAHDPLAFVAAPAFLMGVALIACYIPARRTTRLDPMRVLRYE